MLSLLTLKINRPDMQKIKIFCDDSFSYKWSVSGSGKFRKIKIPEIENKILHNFSFDTFGIISLE